MCCQDWRIQFDSWPRYWGCQVAVLYSEIFHGCKHWHCELCCLIQRHQDGNQSSLILFPQHFTKFVIDLKYSSTTEDLIKVNFEEFSSFVLQVLTWCRGKEDDNSTNGENIESTTLWMCHGLKKNLQINVCLLMNSYQGQWAICCCQVIQTSSIWRGPISDNVFPHACSGIEIVVLLNY